MKPKLTLRDLFWLTLVVACLCGWFIHATSLKQEAIRAQNAFLEAEIRLEKRKTTTGSGAINTTQSWMRLHPKDTWLYGTITFGQPVWS